MDGGHRAKSTTFDREQYSSDGMQQQCIIMEHAQCSLDQKLVLVSTF